MTSVHGLAVAGGTFPATIWGDFMRVVVERDGGSDSFDLPDEPMTWSPFTSDFTRSAAASAGAWLRTRRFNHGWRRIQASIGSTQR